MLRKISSKVCKRARRRLLAVRLAELGCCGELAVDRSLRSVPEHVGDQQDHDGCQHAVDDARECCVLPGEMHKVDIPSPTEHRRRANDQKGPDTVLQSHFDDGGRAASLERTGRSQQLLDRSPARGDGGRQKD